MKLVMLEGPRVGVLRDGGVIDVTEAFADIRFRTAADLAPRVIAALSERRERIETLAVAGQLLPNPTLLAPVPRPPKLLACFGNFRDGTDRERNTQDMFLESPDSVIGPAGVVVLPPHDASSFHHEAELALVIGARAKDLPADDSAYAALAGYTCGIDVSGRGIGRMPPSRIGKSFDTFTPLGPAIVTPDEVGDPHDLRVTLTVNGQARHDYSTSDMEYSVPEILAFASGYMTLVPGDVILCGTNHQGIGPLQDGDQVIMTIEKVGTLEVSVRDERRREWPRAVDHAMAARVRA
jgi:2-keto-4-pentenoate hydratase/2-oxohepta-3-ene-1,7-dioic acid hydratase in catechol pathway